ncbi:hypothetical protein [Microbacterium sp. KNMS]
MPLVTITGNLRDHGLKVMPAQFQQRLWFKPNEGHIRSSYAMDGDRVYATLAADGSFSVDVWSEPSTPDLWYTLCTDWLPPGQELEPTEERARGYFEWPVKIFPDVGGPIGDLVDIIQGIGLVYVSTDVHEGMSPVPRYQLAYNPSTTWLYLREITW